MKRFDAILASLKNQGLSKVGSTEELLDWLFREETNLLRYVNRDISGIAQELGLDEKLAAAIMRSRPFVAAVFDELHYRTFNPEVLNKVYQVIIRQLMDPDVPLGAKRSIIEFMFRQMGLEKPRKLSVKQQSEIVVRVEPTKPVEVLEVLGVPVEPDALPTPSQAPALSANSPGEIVDLFLEASEPISDGDR